MNFRFLCIHINYLFCCTIIGECWVKLLQNINETCTNEAQLMLSVWLKHELENNVISRTQSDCVYFNKLILI